MLGRLKLTPEAGLQNRLRPYGLMSRVVFRVRILAHYADLVTARAEYPAFSIACLVPTSAYRHQGMMVTETEVTELGRLRDLRS